MKRFILVAMVAVICIVIMTGCQKIEREEEWSVTASVTDKEHRNSYTTMIHIRTGNVSTMSPIFHPEKNLVTISYEGVSRTFDDKELYESSEIGDTFQMILYKAYNKDKEVIKEELRFSE